MTIKDFSEIKGQYHVLRAIEIALVGNHSLMIIGEPGSGKTMLQGLINSLGLEAVVYAYNSVFEQDYLRRDDQALILTVRPCPCGFLHSDKRECICSSEDAINWGLRNRYNVDMWIELVPLTFDKIFNIRQGESTEVILDRVSAAKKRLSSVNDSTDPEALTILKSAFTQLNLTTGETLSIFNVAVTLAAMDNEISVMSHHMAEAISYRKKW